MSHLPDAVERLEELPADARPSYEQVTINGRTIYRRIGWRPDTAKSAYAPVVELESMSEADKQAYVDSYGLEAFSRLVAAAGLRARRAVEQRVRGF